MNSLTSLASFLSNLGYMVEDHYRTNDKVRLQAEKLAESLMEAYLNRNRDSMPEAAITEIREGRKIPAIKAWREVTGGGLAEGKAAVEKWAAENGYIWKY